MAGVRLSVFSPRSGIEDHQVHGEGLGNRVLSSLRERGSHQQRFLPKSHLQEKVHPAFAKSIGLFERALVINWIPARRPNAQYCDRSLIEKTSHI
jgi:hypothetical protein